MNSMKVAVCSVAAVLWAGCADDGVRHTPDAAQMTDAAVDGSPDTAPLSPAMLAASPGATDFGDVVIGQTTSKVTYTISNSGQALSGAISVTLAPTTGGFAISDNTCNDVKLGEYDTCTFAVAWTPSVAGTDMATLHIAASPGGEVTPSLTGNGLQPGALDITEASHDFTKLALGATPTTHTFTVKNTGQVATGKPMPSITGTANAYSVASTTCNAALGPTATCSVVVKFNPATVGSKPATLVVTGNPGGSDSATLSGIGVAHVAITKTGNGTGTVVSNLAGINCGSACAADFSSTPVTLSATADTGMTFGGWSGGCSGMQPCSLDLTEGKAVGASFTKQQFALTTSTTGNGFGTIAPASGTYDYNTIVTLTPTPQTGSTFTGWGGDCSGMGACSVTMTQARNVTASFTLKTFTLTTSTTGSGQGTVGGAGTYNYGDTVTVTESPAASSNFTNWGGDCSGLGACTVTMTQNRAVSANFALKTFTLTTSTTGSGQGTVGGAGTYTYGTPVTLTESAAASSSFTSWGGDCSGSGACTVTMTANHAVSANFNLRMLTLTTSTTGSGQGTIGGGGTYTYGTPVTLTESAATGSTFTTWGGDCSGTGTCTVTMTANHAVSANFDAIPETLTVTSTTSNGADGGKIVSSPAGISCDNATCTHNFGYGTPVTLSASLNTGYYVAAVVGAGCTSLPCTVPMTQAQSVTVRLAPLTFTLSVTVDTSLAPGSVIVTIGGVSTTYTANTSISVPYGQAVTLTESHQSDWLFGGWGGACSGNGRGATCNLTIQGNTSASVKFLQVSYDFALVVTTQTPNGIGYGVDYAASPTLNKTCASSTTGTTCTAYGPTFQSVTLTAHQTVFGVPLVWNNLPTWTGCDTVSADRLTCTYADTGPGHVVTVTGDMRVGP